MASPPTITLTTTNALSAARSIPSRASGDGFTTWRINPLFRYRKCGSPVMAGSVFPDYRFVRFTNVDYGPTGGKQANQVGIPVLTDADEIVFLVKGMTGSITAKINGQYVSLTPSTIPNDGSDYFYHLDFGSTEMREIEVIGSGNLRFGGIYVAATATVGSVAARGPKTIVLADSFGEGTGASTITDRMIQVLGDSLGWDDVIPSGVGSTGLLAEPGDKLTYRQRLATDVIPHAPAVVMIWVSINDITQLPAAMVAEARLLVAELRAALPDVRIVFTSIGVNKGPGFLTSRAYEITDSLAAMARSLGLGFINLIDQPLPVEFAATPTTLVASATAGATSIRTADVVCSGSTYKFADGSRVLATAVAFSSGAYTVTIDNLPNNQANGAILTPCGNSLWRGNGRVGATAGNGNCDVVVSGDGTHPTSAGYKMIAAGLAYGLLNALAA